jgi:hypothetical protein
VIFVFIYWLFLSKALKSKGSLQIPKEPACQSVSRTSQKHEPLRVCFFFFFFFYYHLFFLFLLSVTSSWSWAWVLDPLPGVAAVVSTCVT